MSKKRKKPKPPAVPAPVAETRRQKIIRLLEKYTLDFEELRSELGLSRKALEEELGHLDKTVKRRGGKLVMDPALCLACGYEFEVRSQRRFHAPKRCPACKEERVAPPNFHILADEGPGDGKIRIVERRIVLMRHAKSSWKSDAPTDHERPLNKRGRRDAPRVGAALQDRGWVPDLTVSSDSARTRETWARMWDRLETPPPVDFTPSLYHAGVEETAEVVARVDPGVTTLMLLGHNPGWEEVLSHLTGLDETLTTANAALLRGEGATWVDAWKGAPGWRLEALLRPKELD